jgi:hypothetical protein
MRAHSGISPALAAASPAAKPAPRAPRPSPNDSGTWFEAACAFGHVGLCASPGTQTACHAAEAAIMLREAEPLLAALDEWTGAELAWRWVEAPPQGRLARARRRGDSQVPECLVFWPWAMLRSLPAPRAGLAAQLDWPIVAAELVLGRLQIGLHELELLEPGGAVLISQSMQPAWQGTLRAADEAPDATSGVAVDLSDPACPRLADRDARSAATAAPVDPMHALCELRLDVPLGVSTQRLAGWRREGDSGEIVRLAGAALRAALWRCATPREPLQRLAAGRLMPWGDGWALAVETPPELPGGQATQKL